MIKEDEDQREDDHAEDLEHHAGVVDDRDQADAEDAQQRGAQQDERCHVAKRVRVGPDVHAHVVEKRDQYQRHCGHDSGDGQDASKEVDPAGEPGVRPARQILRPLVDGSRHREVRADLGEVEGDDQLADDDDGPAPAEEGPCKKQAQDEQSEDAGAR